MMIDTEGGDGRLTVDEGWRFGTEVYKPSQDPTFGTTFLIRLRERENIDIIAAAMRQ